ncbi:MAG: hypothetical protein Q7S93_07465 [Phenylobacterium sp.]|nr:hypothetical protein [Phenylobacterium sp.]MDO8409883.1 hypothetical protein [Phenylobacterium sp.]
MSPPTLIVVAASAVAALLVASVESEAANPRPLSPDGFVALLDEII